MTVIVEGALALAMACSTNATRKRDEQECFIFSSTSRTFQVSTGQSLESAIKDDLFDLNGVSAVRISRLDRAFTVTVDLVLFDKATRRAVYAMERAFNEKYNGYTFDVYLVDQSELTKENAFKG